MRGGRGREEYFAALAAYEAGTGPHPGIVPLTGPGSLTDPATAAEPPAAMSRNEFVDAWIVGLNIGPDELTEAHMQAADEAYDRLHEPDAEAAALEAR